MAAPNLQPRRRLTPQEQEDERNLKRRLRTNFSELQSQLLEEAFQESHYPDQNRKRKMSMQLDIPEDRITVWFQNRRAKWRRKETREKERAKSELPLLDVLPNPAPLQPEFPDMFVDSFTPDVQFNSYLVEPQCQQHQLPLPSCNQIAFSNNPTYYNAPYNVQYPQGQ